MRLLSIRPAKARRASDGLIYLRAVQPSFSPYRVGNISAKCIIAVFIEERENLAFFVISKANSTSQEIIAI